MNPDEEKETSRQERENWAIKLSIEKAEYDEEAKEKETEERIMTRIVNEKIEAGVKDIKKTIALYMLQEGENDDERISRITQLSVKEVELLKESLIKLKEDRSK